jgi:hypothetical protein
MRSLRLIALVIVFAAAVAGAWWFVAGRNHVSGDSIVVYYTKIDGTTEVPKRYSLGPARDRASVAFYAASQALIGPEASIEAVRFPTGTRVNALTLDGSTVNVDISTEVNSSAEGGFTETAEFKSLVWTLTDPQTLPGINRVRVKIGGARVATLPGGHFELDEPLSRATF